MSELFEEHKKALEENGLIKDFSPNSATVKFAVSKHVEVSQDFAVDFCIWVEKNQNKLPSTGHSDLKTHLKALLANHYNKSQQRK